MAAPSTRAGGQAPGAAALIIAGGRGTRFWPESRAGRPKPLFAIDGKTSLLEETIARTQPLISKDRIFVLVAADQRDAFRRVLRGVIPPRNLIVEPSGRGTAIAIAYGGAVIAQRLGAETVVAVMPADHYVTPASGFRTTIASSIALAAANDAIVVIGVTPTRPETGYGYQKIGRAIGAGFKVDRFVEKPETARARQMVKSGKFLWNAGIFVMRIATLARELGEHAPGLATAMSSLATLRAAELSRAYGKLEFDSFDRVVAEKSGHVLSVRARFRWFDVGSWEGLWEALSDGAAGNVTRGNVIAIDSDGVIARGGKRLMVLMGVSDLVAVDTGDAILIARRSQSQEVRRVPEELARRGLSRYL
jgi:mannose-1-phosphate guanylyltransferase/mannose-6-phosphate isomerase